MIIDAEGNNLWVFPRLKALEMKDEAWLDLVQISYDRDKMISTVKLVDYGKYMYEKGKEDKEKKKKQKHKETKEIKISYAIGENDLALKIQHAKEFLSEWHAVKFSTRLRWREKIYANKAKEKLINVQNQLLDLGRPKDNFAKEEANGYSIILFAKKH